MHRISNPFDSWANENRRQNFILPRVQNASTIIFPGQKVGSWDTGHSESCQCWCGMKNRWAPVLHRWLKLMLSETSQKMCGHLWHQHQDSWQPETQFTSVSRSWKVPDIIWHSIPPAICFFRVCVRSHTRSPSPQTHPSRSSHIRLLFAPTLEHLSKSAHIFARAFFCPFLPHSNATPSGLSAVAFLGPFLLLQTLLWSLWIHWGLQSGLHCLKLACPHGPSVGKWF